ncbi:nucleoside-diphosphate kinase [Candidatus Protochlamydia phocaeensis]|uniref:nucleoside-diphosphate kinase n=1 Tax=Candidatus Protochlamydia phocaeensis TaxID=1414722 RepID=UPI000839860E
MQEDRRFGNAQRQPIEVQERTLSIIKPDAVRQDHIGDIISRFEHAGLHVAGIKMVHLNKNQAAQFYRVHRDRPFFPGLVDFMASGPVIVLVLEGDQAVAKNRQLMGATDPKKAEKGTIRADYAESVSQNAVHGSDSPEAAKEEILFFFRPNELYSHTSEQQQQQ